MSQSITRCNPAPKLVNKSQLENSLTILPSINFHSLDKLSDEEKADLDISIETFLKGPFKDAILLTLDLDHMTVRPVLYVVYQAVNSRYPEIFPHGVSIATRSSDGRAVAINRSKANGENKGAIGPVAGFIKTTVETLEKGNVTLKALLDNQIREELGHEVGITEFTTNWENVLEIQSNYPKNQKEFCVSVDLAQSLGEVLNVNDRVSNGEAFQVSEKVVDISDDEIVERIETTDCASQHAFALLISMGWSLHCAAKFIEELPIPQKK